MAFTDTMRDEFERLMSDLVTNAWRSGACLGDIGAAMAGAMADIGTVIGETSSTPCHQRCCVVITARKR